MAFPLPAVGTPAAGAVGLHTPATEHRGGTLSTSRGAGGCKATCRSNTGSRSTARAASRGAGAGEAPQGLTDGGCRASWLAAGPAGSGASWRWGAPSSQLSHPQPADLHSRRKSKGLRAYTPSNSEELAEPSPSAADEVGSKSSNGVAVPANGASAINGGVTVSSDGGPRSNGGVTASDSGAPAKQGFQWQRRWTIVALCFVAFLLCNMDRVNMSIAILPMAEEFKWSPATVGLVQSSFFWGYLLTQVAGGVWADTYGGKQVLGFGVIWWSLATVLTPLAAKAGLPTLLFARACMGIGEGVAMPAMNNLLSKWVPVGERSRSLALVYSGMYLGSVLGLSLSPGLIHGLGWPSVFYSFGSLGVLWFLAWQSKAKSSPSEDPSLSTEERQLLMGAPKAQPEEAAGGGGGGHFAEGPLKLSGIPWRKLLSKGPVWAIIVSHFCHNWGVFILLTWMPTYYHDVLGFDLTKSGLFAVLPWLTMAVASNVAGWIADSLICKGWDVTTVRKTMQTIGFMGPAICLSLLSKVTSPVQAILLLMVSQGTDAFSQSGLYSNHQDIGPQYAGVLLGLSNTAGVLAGVIGTYVTGRILQSGSWDQVFEVAVVLYLVGTVVWNLFSTGKRVFPATE